MKAAVYHKYGPPEVVRIEDVEKPVPRDNEVLIRVHAATVSAADWRMRTADPVIVRIMNGLWRPKKTPILGMEFAGVVESVGKAVTRFAAGDQVFGSNGLKFGGHAEYVCAPENVLAAKPVNMTLEEAAAVLFGGVSALFFLRKGNIQAGQKVLIYGASGSVGVFAVQLAKHFGARVTGVCSTANLEMVRSLGADEVVNYTCEDFSKAGRVYDMVFDAAGKSGFSRSLRSLKRGGSYVQVGGGGTAVVAVMGDGSRDVGLPHRRREIRYRSGERHPGRPVIPQGADRGRRALRTVIDRRYPLDRIAEAHRYVEAGHKKGHVVILIANRG